MEISTICLLKLSTHATSAALSSCANSESIRYPASTASNFKMAKSDTVVKEFIPGALRQVHGHPLQKLGLSDQLVGTHARVSTTHPQVRAMMSRY
eukprot:1719822-Rhodomonas_salina.3